MMYAQRPRATNLAPWDCSEWCLGTYPASWQFPEWQKCVDACKQEWGWVAVRPQGGPAQPIPGITVPFTSRLHAPRTLRAMHRMTVVS